MKLFYLFAALMWIPALIGFLVIFNMNHVLAYITITANAIALAGIIVGAIANIWKF